MCNIPKLRNSYYKRFEITGSSPTFHEGQTSRQEVGDDVILHCSADREVHLCRWKTPYLNTYIVGEGIYVERGRIQWLGKDPNFDCTIRVANLDLRDAGTWVCEIGSSTKESFQVQTKEFVIDIESKNFQKDVSKGPPPNHNFDDQGNAKTTTLKELCK